MYHNVRLVFRSNPGKLCFSLGILTNYIPFTKKKHVEVVVQNENVDVIKKADTFYENGCYLDAYKLLNEKKSTGIEFYSDGEVLWRVCRVLHKLSLDKSTEIRGDIINEAFNLITIAHLNKKNHAEINKWMAIILDTKSELEGVKSKVQNAAVIKQHLLRAHELNPKDHVTLYMIGHWCFSMSSFSWIQRQSITYLYGPLPNSSFEEAHNYFLKAEELKPRSFIPNLYMLGKVNLVLNRYFRARYYLNVAANLKIRNPNEALYQQDSVKLLKKLDFYDITNNFGFIDF